MCQRKTLDKKLPWHNGSQKVSEHLNVDVRPVAARFSDIGIEAPDAKVQGVGSAAAARNVTA